MRALVPRVSRAPISIDDGQIIASVVHILPIVKLV